MDTPLETYKELLKNPQNVEVDFYSVHLQIPFSDTKSRQRIKDCLGCLRTGFSLRRFGVGENMLYVSLGMDRGAVSVHVSQPEYFNDPDNWINFRRLLLPKELEKVQSNPVVTEAWLHQNLDYLLSVYGITDKLIHPDTLKAISKDLYSKLEVEMLFDSFGKKD